MSVRTQVLAALAAVLVVAGAVGHARSPQAAATKAAPPAQASLRPADLAVRRLSEAELASAVRAKVDAQAAGGRFQGAVLVARNGRVIFSEAKGLADRDAGTPNTLETRFRMGSMNKMFTATAIMQLVQAGKEKLDAPLGTYLTNYANRDVATKETIHH